MSSCTLLEKVIDECIGSGRIFACFKFRGDTNLTDRDSLEFAVRGTLHAHDEANIAQQLANSLRRSRPEAKPEAVRIVMVQGSWVEEITWSGKWHPVQQYRA